MFAHYSTTDVHQVISYIDCDDTVTHKYSIKIKTVSRNNLYFKK